MQKRGRSESGCPVIRCNDFLINSDNKQQLGMVSTITVVSNVHNSVHQSASASTLSPIEKHKESDTRIFIHIIDMVTNGITKIGIRAVLVFVLATYLSI